MVFGMKIERGDIKKKNKSEGDAPSKFCPKCDELLHTTVMFCPCGYEFPKKVKSKIEVILENLTPSEVVKLSNSGNLSIKELEEVRENKGYKIGWVLHKLSTIHEYQEYGKLKNYSPKWASYQFNNFR